MEKEGLQKQSLTILQQIEALKIWHKQQQLKLSTDSEEIQIKKVQNNKKQQIENNIVTQQVFDEMPIQVSSPNFRDLVENSLTTVSNEQSKPNTNVKKPHRFLRKGEGIARFGMGPRKVPRSNGKTNNRVLCLSGISLTKKDDENCFSKPQQQNLAVGQTVNKAAVLPLETPDVKLGIKNWKQIFESGKAEAIIEKAIINNQLELFQPDSSFNSSTASNLEKIYAVAKNWKDKQELRAFETMEQHILDSSFCSSSSFVLKVMKDAVISTPTKVSDFAKNSFDPNTNPNHFPTAILENEVQKLLIDENLRGRPEPPIWTDPKDLKDLDLNPHKTVTPRDLEESLHVKFSDDIDYKSFTDYSQSLSNSNWKDSVNTNEEFNDKEEWHEESGEDSVCSSRCDCSTTYSSSDEDVRAISPPGKLPTVLQNHLTNNPKQRSPVERLEVADLENKETLDKEKEAPSVGNKVMVGEKVKELEDEIEVFKTLNKKLESVRESLEKERKQLQQEKNKFLKEINEEKIKSAAQLEEEKKKLAKEKLVFEKYSKTLSKNPTKDERKEIQILREQLSEIKEELNKKESRWGAAQARVRNQVKLLEEDNKKLREEVEVLRKQAKYLEVLTQKRGKPFNNTKLIHAISEYISNNPIESNDPTPIPGIGSYFSPKENPVKTVLIEVDTNSTGNVRVIKENKQENKSRKPSNSVEQAYQQMATGGKTTTPSQNYSKKEPNYSMKDVSTKINTKDTHNEAPHTQKNKEMSSNQHAENSSNFPSELVNEDGTIETVYPDGRKEIKYKNGNIKKIDPFSGSEKTIYFNGDVKEMLLDGTSKYYFSESRVWQTTLRDGLELLDFPNGQVEKRHTSGLVEIIYPNGCKKLTYPDGSEEVHYANGTRLRIEADKTQTLFLLNGQKEIHTNEYVRREYPDGTTKTVFADGVTETVYSNGRVRLKDKDGNLVMDSATSVNRL